MNSGKWVNGEKTKRAKPNDSGRVAIGVLYFRVLDKHPFLETCRTGKPTESIAETVFRLILTNSEPRKFCTMNVGKNRVTTFHTRKTVSNLRATRTATLATAKPKKNNFDIIFKFNSLSSDDTVSESSHFTSHSYSEVIANVFSDAIVVFASI